MSLKKINDLLVVNLYERCPYIKLSEATFLFYLIENIVDDSGKYALLVINDVHSVSPHCIAFTTFFRI